MSSPDAIGLKSRYHRPQHHKWLLLTMSETDKDIHFDPDGPLPDLDLLDDDAGQLGSSVKRGRGTGARWSKFWVMCAGLFALCLIVAPIVWLGRSGDLRPMGAFAEAQSGVARVSGMSASGNKDLTRVTIRLDRDPDHTLFGLTEPSPRLVLDMPRVVFALGTSQNEGQSGSLKGGGAVTGFRFSHKSQNQSRIVIDLTGPMRIEKQEIVNVLGGKALRLDLVPSATGAFANIPPPPKSVPSATSLPVPAPLKAGQSGRRFVIVIDAGHGGKDPGAVGDEGRLIEKNATLASALALRDYLRKDRRFDIILTRDTDTFLTLERRILIARDRRADLFLSLHADAAPPTSKANGATVYTLSEEGGERARRLLNNDNWSVAPASQTQDQSVVDILKDLTQRDTKNQSAIFGQGLIEEIHRVGPVTATSHRRAGFFVLLSPRVPAVLLEMGFVTDPDDAKRLQDPAFRSRQMAATSRAIGAYFDRVQVIRDAASTPR